MVTRKKTLVRTLVVALVVLAAALMTTAVLAAPGPTGSMHVSGCSVYYDVTVSPMGTPEWVSLWEYDNGNYNGLQLWDAHTFPGPGTYDISGKFFVGEGSDGEKLELWYYDYNYNWTLLDSLTFHCNGEEATNWNFSVEGMGDAASYSYNGTPACGVFDVLGWGAKTVDLNDYANCTGDVMVMCLDGEGNWTDVNVSNFTQEGTVVQWTSSQDGTCAFFEK